MSHPGRNVGSSLPPFRCTAERGGAVMSSTDLQSHVWTPCPDCAPFHIRCPADALALAVGWPELPEFGLLMATLDADRRVELMVTNPSPELVFFPDRIERPGLPRPVHGVTLFSIAPDTADTPPGFSFSMFNTLHCHYREAGIRLVDWVHIDFEENLYRSMRICARELQGTTADYLRAGVCV